MTFRVLKKHADKWIAALRLTEWEITLSFKPQAELEAHNVSGSSCWQPEYKVATVEIASDQPDSEIIETLVHELLHLCLEGHKPIARGYRYDAQYEYALNTLSEVLAKKR